MGRQPVCLSHIPARTPDAPVSEPRSGISLCARSHRDAMTTLPASTSKHRASTLRAHPRSKAMCLLAAAAIWLKRPLHSNVVSPVSHTQAWPRAKLAMVPSTRCCVNEDWLLFFQLQFSFLLSARRACARLRPSSRRKKAAHNYHSTRRGPSSRFFPRLLKSLWIKFSLPKSAQLWQSDV